jgi:hypothetical protein
LQHEIAFLLIVTLELLVGQVDSIFTADQLRHF